MEGGVRQMERAGNDPGELREKEGREERETVLMIIIPTVSFAD